MKRVQTACSFLAGWAVFCVMTARTQEPGSVPEAQAPRAATQNAAPRVVRVSGGVVAGLKISGDNPVYPPDAKAQHIGGSVVLHAIIGQDGRIESLEVISGNRDLAQAAWDAVKTWTYKPYLLNGEPTAVETTITVNFQLGAPPAPQAGNEMASPVPSTGSLPAQRVRVSSGVMAGLKIRGDLILPAETDTSGGVVLHAIIGRDGTIESLTPMHGRPELDQVVMESVRHWQYKPYLLNGRPVEVDTVLTMYW